MTKSLSISAEDLLNRYEEAIRKDPDMALRMIIWLTIYDEQSASWAREFLEDSGLMPNPETEANKRCEAGLVIEAEKGEATEKIKRAQLRLIDRKRETLEKSVRLPPRTKRGATSDYKLALYEWKRINPRPTKEELLAGWVPKPLPESFNPQVPHQADEETAVPAASAPTPAAKKSAATKIAKATTEALTPKEPEVVVEEKKPAVSQRTKTPSPQPNEDLPTQQEVENIHRLLDADDEEDARLYS